MTALPKPVPLHAQLRDLAGRLLRLRPDWQRPERYFEARSDLAAELRHMAAEAEPRGRTPMAIHY